MKFSTKTAKNLFVIFLVMFLLGLLNFNLIVPQRTGSNVVQNETVSEQDPKASFNVDWTIYFDNGTDDIETFVDLKIDAEDNVITCGTVVDDSTYDSFLLIVKYNSMKKQLWNRTWTDSEKEIDAKSLLVNETTGNIYVIAENRSSAGIILIRYDKDGNYLGNTTWYDGISTSINSGAIAPNGSIYVAGDTNTGSDRDVLIVQFDSSGNQIWNKTLDSPGSAEYINDMCINSNGDLYLVGDTDASGLEDILLIKLDKDGNKDWDLQKDYNNTKDSGESIVLDQNEDILITGIYDEDGQKKLPILKYNKTSQLDWETVYYNETEIRGWDIDVNPFSDEIYVTGSVSSAPAYSIIIKLDPSGTLDSFLLWDDYNQTNLALIFTPDTGVPILCGFYIPAGRYDDATLIKNPTPFQVVPEAPEYDEEFTLEILSPEINQVFGENAPVFQISLSGKNLDEVWYVINSGDNYYVEENISIIDQDLWDSLDDGYITIEFFAKNSTGFTISQKIIVLKDTDSAEDSESLADSLDGANLLLTMYIMIGLLAFLGIASTISIFKKG